MQEFNIIGKRYSRDTIMALAELLQVPVSVIDPIDLRQDLALIVRLGGHLITSIEFSPKKSEVAVTYKRGEQRITCRRLIPRVLGTSDYESCDKYIAEGIITTWLALTSSGRGEPLLSCHFSPAYLAAITKVPGSLLTDDRP